MLEIVGGLTAQGGEEREREGGREGDRGPNFACPNFISLLDLDPVLLGLFNHPAEIADDLLRYTFP